ncbi:hypothetical protein BJ165DRAFT_1533560 [Panaeolus papilionaceus]|nr:hypothetical protein BJ165DRAFT_1533560 [Panaeolus papilionaceus]
MQGHQAVSSSPTTEIHAEVQGDDMLASTPCPRIQEAENDQAQFRKELDDSGLLPPPPPSAPAQVLEASVTLLSGLSAQRSSTHSTIVLQDNDNLALTQMHALSNTNAQSTFDADRAIRVDNAAGFSPTERPAVQAVSPLHPPRPPSLGLCFCIIKFLKCWGDAVADRHED